MCQGRSASASTSVQPSSGVLRAQREGLWASSSQAQRMREAFIEIATHGALKGDRKHFPRRRMGVRELRTARLACPDSSHAWGNQGLECSFNKWSWHSTALHQQNKSNLWIFS